MASPKRKRGKLEEEEEDEEVVGPMPGDFSGEPAASKREK